MDSAAIESDETLVSTVLLACAPFSVPVRESVFTVLYVQYVWVYVWRVGKCNFEQATEPTHQADWWRSSGLNFDISSFWVHKLFCVEVWKWKTSRWKNI